MSAEAPTKDSDAEFNLILQSVRSIVDEVAAPFDGTRIQGTLAALRTANSDNDVIMAYYHSKFDNSFSLEGLDPDSQRAVAMLLQGESLVAAVKPNLSPAWYFVVTVTCQLHSQHGTVFAKAILDSVHLLGLTLGFARAHGFVPPTEES